MMKKIVLTLLLCLPFVAGAQQKIAIVNTQEVMAQMPEFKEAQNKLNELGKKYDADYKAMQQEIEKKAEAFDKEKDSLSEVLKKTRQQEIQDMVSRLGQSERLMSEDLQKQQQMLMAPIQQKVYDALKKVGDENGYAYIMEAQLFHYTGASAVDCTAQLKAKLGIK
ncbi:cationic outer membrane protein OmpH [Porphyromonas crevioricanis JCM 15906]|nr:cationic outer membrane protein OmpH [Porphyromonas crevioricanis JCM 15906]GAD07273.1 cationic outer membrane protein OmpH [Porphyromonas crevioricanis JCM 13913]